MQLENLIRLLRRRLACLNSGREEEAEEIIGYLRGQGLLFEDYDPKDPRMAGWLRRRDVQTQQLVQEFGGAWLIDYNELIFLNRAWRNPWTLYVRLVEEVPELGELGMKYYDPAEGKGFSE